MNKFLTLLFCTVCTLSTIAQTRDLVVFTDDGLKFTLIVDGDVKNATPASRVVATGIKNDTPLCLVKFEDKSMPDVKQNMWLEAGKEYTVVVTTNKKGVKVMRPQGEAELGTTKVAEVKPDPVKFEEDKPATMTTNTQVEGTTMNADMSVGGVQQTTTVTQTETIEDDGMEGENVNMNLGINGVGINMNVGVTGTGTGTGSTTTTSRTTTTRTTTTTSSSSSPAPVAVQKPAPKPAPVEPYRMPGYTGPIGCAMPMSPTEFDEAKTSIAGKSFEDSKMTLAKQIGGSHCFSTDQVKALMGLFSFEESKLDFAKFAYDHTHDIGNYYKVNDAFQFESSIDDLNEYLKSK